MEGALISVLSALITGIFSFLAAIYKSKSDLKREISRLEKQHENELEKLKAQTEMEILKMEKKFENESKQSEDQAITELVKMAMAHNIGDIYKEIKSGKK
ncbi:hypothetical protein [Halalkalibacterium halodurans]|uniref:hypothetical protein n=1 Tax=Halalkalibacterium halodurans TaxID=86665 RepID=UPI002AA9D1E3|nr:hypothetical protein [Halalkalibacterium halodurans]MDY7222068.1 hypothetical protein [Halalkalibacterium halodurans]MDY7243913.1 hypothetical protein [Halalkalibacterium halodurans]